MRARLVLLGIVALGALVLLVESKPGSAQPPSPGRQGGKFGKGGFKFDPGALFDRFTEGKKGVFVISEARFGREALELFAKREGISDGKITRDQFLKYWEVKDKLQEEVVKSGGGTPSPGGAPGKGGPGGFDPEALFKKFDTNGDGFLNAEEIAQIRDFKAEWQKWDANKDNLISLPEWKAYMDARAKEWNDRKGTDGKDPNAKPAEKPAITRIEIDEVENTTVVVYRAGKLPKGIPTWFAEYDANQDGQVSLGEWLKKGKSAAEFAKIDRNDDGLITIEEALRSAGVDLAILDPNAANEGDVGETEVTKPATPQAVAGRPGFGGGKGGFKGVPGFGGQVPGRVPGFGGQSGFGSRQGFGGFPGGGKKGKKGGRGNNPGTPGGG